MSSHYDQEDLTRFFRDIKYFAMIMYTLLSMVYGLFKPCRLMHVAKDITSLVLHVATCFKEAALLFNVRLSFFVDFILCPTDKYMSKVNN